MNLIDISKAIIFDMDGTLIASTHADYLAWKKLFADYEIKFSYEDYVPALGIKSAELAKDVLHIDGEQLQQALKRKLVYFDEAIAAEGLNAIPYAAALLDYLQKHNIKMALATSSRREKMAMAMQHTDLLKYFDTIVTGEEVAHGKPAPDIFLLAAKKLNIHPSECIVVEDATRGIAAAKNAGMYCVAITTTHTADKLQGADLIIESFEELLEPNYIWNDK
jgi:beta-phosphoglucomutase family hydrolase